MSKLRVYLTNLGKYNEGELVGEWVDLPVSDEELQQVYQRIGISDKPDPYGNYYEETFITDYESDIDDLYVGEYDSITELNRLAEILESWDEGTVNMFEAACEAGYTDVNDIADFDTDDYYFAPDVSSDEELGYYEIDTIYGGIERLAMEEEEAITKHRMKPEDSIISTYCDFSEIGREFAAEFHLPDWIEIPYGDEEAMQQLADEYDVDDVEDIDAYTYFGVSNDTDLGEMITDGVPSSSVDYFDYEDYGRNIRVGDGGSYVSNGYISKLR